MRSSAWGLARELSEDLAELVKKTDIVGLAPMLSAAAMCLCEESPRFDQLFKEPLFVEHYPNPSGVLKSLTQEFQAKDLEDQISFVEELGVELFKCAVDVLLNAVNVASGTLSEPASVVTVMEVPSCAPPAYACRPTSRAPVLEDKPLVEDLYLHRAAKIALHICQLDQVFNSRWHNYLHQAPEISKLEEQRLREVFKSCAEKDGMLSVWVFEERLKGDAQWAEFFKHPLGTNADRILKGSKKLSWKEFRLIHRMQIWESAEADLADKWSDLRERLMKRLDEFPRSSQGLHEDWLKWAQGASIDPETGSCEGRAWQVLGQSTLNPWKHHCEKRSRASDSVLADTSRDPDHPFDQVMNLLEECDEVLALKVVHPPNCASNHREIQWVVQLLLLNCAFLTEIWKSLFPVARQKRALKRMEVESGLHEFEDYVQVPGHDIICFSLEAWSKLSSTVHGSSLLSPLGLLEPPGEQKHGSTPDTTSLTPVACSRRDSRKTSPRYSQVSSPQRNEECLTVTDVCQVCFPLWNEGVDVTVRVHTAPGSTVSYSYLGTC